MTDEPIRVARVIARTNVGGPSLQITALMRHLDRRFDQRLLAGTVDDGEADYLDLRAPDVAVTRIPGLGRRVKLTGDLRAFVAIVRELRRFRPTIVHTHTAKAGTLGRLAAVVARVPIRVHTFHGHVLHGYFGTFGTWLVVTVERVLRPVTTYAVAVGEPVRQDLIRAQIISARHSSVIAPGVVKPATIERSTARRAFALPDDGIVVVFVGRLTRIKRTERFVDLARASRHLEGVMFAVVGDGPDRDEMEQRSADLTNVRFLGWQADLAAVYAAADLIALTSDNEGMPVALIEAAMQGVPAVATDVGGVGQVVLDGRTGLLVAPGDAAGLAGALESLVVDADRRRAMGEAASAHALANFGEDRLVDDYARLYTQLVDERAQRRRWFRRPAVRRPQ